MLKNKLFDIFKNLKKRVNPEKLGVKVVSP